MALEDNTLLHIEFESSEPTINDQIRYAYYELRLFSDRQQLIRRIIVYAAGIQKTPDPLYIGTLSTHQHSIHLSRHFDGYRELDRVLTKIAHHERLDAEDKLRIMLLPMMFEHPRHRSRAAWLVTEALDAEKTDDAAYLIGTMFACNYSTIANPEKNKILEVLEMSQAFQELYRRLEEKGMAKGMEKGMEQGIEKTAIAALKEGASPIFVSKITGLPMEKIEELHKRIKQER
ncbi:hypothetical protein [Heliophilum fasciatum]|uniref:hypothetical protein n=1 Tax=Heliophilum fasciatum TaxID=35700 RepID=UPI0010464A15|nr:hypothetical protein [Heliophilum fasciatum]MCW2279141.1 hypothetical protein [Heliophilum fasciatum]